MLDSSNPAAMQQQNMPFAVDEFAYFVGTMRGEPVQKNDDGVFWAMGIRQGPIQELDHVLCAVRTLFLELTAHPIRQLEASGNAYARTRTSTCTRACCSTARLGRGGGAPKPQK